MKNMKRILMNIFNIICCYASVDSKKKKNTSNVKKIGKAFDGGVWDGK